jgi:hypothetical protein
LTTRPMRADHATFVVDCPSQRSREVVESAFIDLPDGDDPDPVTIRLRSDDRDTWSVLVGDELRFAGQSPNQAMGSLVTTVTRIALDADAARLHLHCAAVAKDGCGMLVTARSGTGKTTLAAELLCRGWSYGSDESVAVEAGSETVEAFPKPLMIKDGDRSPVRGLAERRVVLDVEDDRIWTVPASTLGAACTSVLEPTCILVLTTEPRAPGRGPAEPAPIHPADAVVAMMQQTMDAGRYGPSALGVLAGLAARSRCLQMQVGPLDVAADALERLISEPPGRGQVRMLAPSPVPGLPWHLPEHVRSLTIADRAVVHETRGGAISALDEAGTAVWLTLLGQPPDGWGPQLLQNAAIEEFLDQLVALGFVHRGERHAEPA